MKNIFLIGVTLISVIANIQSLASKNFEETSKFDISRNAQKTSDNQNFTFKETSEIKKKIEINIHKNNSENNVNPIYLEDVVYALKNQNWTEDEIPCLNHTLRLLGSLKNFTLWAVWDWDSVSSQPQGLLYGNRYQLGNFDQCMNAPWSKTSPELKTQYCLAEIVLERTDHVARRRSNGLVEPYQSALDFIQHRPKYTRPLNEITWGSCVPASCTSKSVERLMLTLLSRSHLGMAGMRPRINVSEPCQGPDQPRRYDAVFYSFMAVMVLLVSITIVCTYLNHKNRCASNNSVKYDIIESFCLKINARVLLEMKKEGSEVLYGIRFLSIVLIVMCHIMGIFNSGPVSDGMRMDQDSLSVLGMFVLHDDLFVDTFFFLSGFLAASAFKTIKKSIFNPFVIIVKRYIRLSVAFAVVIFCYCAIFPYLGSGPLWNRVVAGETDPCRKNWWLNLLMLSNYVDSENICIVISWYIPCDFHYTLVASLVYWIYNHHRRLGISCAVILATASILTPGIINYISHLPAVQLFVYEFVRDPRANKQFHVTYIKSHTRFAPYIIGFFAGYFYAACRLTGNLKRLSKTWSIIGASAGFAIMLTIMLLGPTYLWRSYHPLEGALYAALNRAIWAGGLALLILCCMLGHVPLVQGFLSWYPWVPLSRLTYGLYLTHCIFISRNVFVTRGSRYNDYLQLFTEGIGVLMLSCLSAFIIWLLAEAPVNNLCTVFLKSRTKLSSIEDTNPENKNTSTITIASNTTQGHLEANLPSTVQCSSKI
ncbi:nose resistant to fluoxetine protein 6-like [Hyposmocoma kahamanoa]|uniref:nose resistant to fluoxetine protein 6-like n=1 Tax=Hyposmocoma kahamanoa TaxID=1477025 RepID=UPI000E6D633B|nr:nose resistant to fluoxetine protein 6-like [Hyposmocoma kahamanoa]